MKQAKATVKEAEALLRWLQKQENADRQPPPYNRTIFGYLLMLEHCADPAKDYIDFRPGTSPDEIAALKQRAEAAEARVKELELKLMRQDEVAREAYEAAVWKYGQERMELEAQLADLRNAGGPPFIRSEAIRNLKADLDGERVSAGRVHGRIGLLANAAFGISDNLDTDTTLQAIEAGINDLKGRITQDHGIVAELEAQNARLLKALEDQLKLAEKQVEFYKDRVDSGEEHLRPFGSEAWRRAKDLKKALNGEEAST